MQCQTPEGCDVGEACCAKLTVTQSGCPRVTVDTVTTSACMIGGCDTDRKTQLCDLSAPKCPPGTACTKVTVTPPFDAGTLLVGACL
jgi:hypothetical protein